MGIRGLIKNAMVTFWQKKYFAKLDQKKMTYEQWLAEGKKACAAVAGEDVPVTLFGLGEGMLAEGAKEKIKAFFAQNPEVVLLYGDEDVYEPDSGKYTDPWYKPDWSPDTFLSGFYWGSMVAVRSDWLEGLEEEDAVKVRPAEDETIFITDVREVAKLAFRAGGYERGCKSIGHIPQILFHSVSKEKQEEFVKRNSLGAKLQDVSPDHLISVIIPSKDHSDLLKQGLKSLLATRGSSRIEVIVVDNGSSEENRRKVGTFLEELPFPCKYLYIPMEFNFSAMCNLGAGEASGELLLFLNDDVEAVCPEWLEKLAQKAMKPYVGAVGLKLYYPGGNKIQHAGIVNLPAGPIHKLQLMADDRSYYFDYNKQDRNVLAVTGACLMVQKDKYRLAGGMKEELQVTYNDVELCFCLWKLGYHNVVRNGVYAYHHESLSRGEDHSEKKQQRLFAEQELLYHLHPECKGWDPYYPAGMNQDVWDSAIRPAYLTAGNSIQEAVFCEETVDLSKYRRDDCLLIGLENCEAGCVRGYSVVLGDDNACYRKRLILCMDEDKKDQGMIRCMSVELEGQYRPDLEENLEGQRNVALSGFWLTASGLKEGDYLVGVLAESKAGNVRLVNWSNKTLKNNGDRKNDKSGNK